MKNQESLDIYMIAGEKDQRLLRHFLISYELFYHSKGKVYLWIWREHEYLLRSFKLPKNLILLFKDDVSELVEDDFRNQMYLKLMAHKYLESDWLWMPDADFLITSPLYKKDFFYGEKPYWYYCDWHNVAEKTWRCGSEKLFGCDIPYQFLDQPQYVVSQKVLKSLSENYDLSNILSQKHLSSEYIIYGYYAYKNFYDLYQWVDNSNKELKPICYKVNQQPPSYCELNEKIKLDQLPSKKYYVFWSHWEKTEKKMVEFLNDAQLKILGKIKLKPDETPLFRHWEPKQIDAGSFNGLDGLHLDGWLMQEVWCCLPSDERNILQIEMMVPSQNSNTIQPLILNTFINEKQTTIELKPGFITLTLDLKKNFNNQIILRFTGGFLEPKGNRNLYAKLEGFQLKNKD
tara:strand:- start:2551 stop:3756 length:1206 start_codon:yes stop_codon:yes gene_type:complete